MKSLNFKNKKNIRLLLILLAILGIASILPPTKSAIRCIGVPLNDTDYYRAEAKKGNSDALYRRAVELNRKENPNGDTIRSAQVNNLYRMAAAKDHVKAVEALCLGYTWQWRFTSKQKWVKDERIDPTVKDDLQWCFKGVALGGNYTAQILGGLYYYGHGVEQSYKEAYYWYVIADNYTTHVKDTEILLSPAEVTEVKKRIEEREKAKYRRVTELPLNVAGLVCGGTAKTCRVTDHCGDLATIACYNSDTPYLVVEKSTSEIISSCKHTGKQGCNNFVPSSWSCPSPKNMPVRLEEFARYFAVLESTSIVSCGDILGVDHGSGGDGPYYFVDKTSLKKIAECSHWAGKCNLPKGWTCGWPSNYH